MATPSDTEDENVTAQCLCGRCSFKGTVSWIGPHSIVSICHCWSCRHSTGTLTWSDMPWSKSDYLEQHDISELARYAFSSRTEVLFCATCGSKLFWHHHGDGNLFVSPAVLDSKRYVPYYSHEWVGDTRDGGLSVWLPAVGSTHIPLYRGSRHNGDKWTAEPAVSRHTNESERLPARCLCGGVQFEISRPTAQSADLVSPYPDSIVAYNSGTSPETSEKWWICPGGRWPASNCMCTSCRLHAGVEVVQWAFVPAVNIHPGTSTTETLATTSLPFGTLKAFISTSGPPMRTRYFCGQCGATVFWRGSERLDLIDVAVGLLHAPEGARAESWLQWTTNRVSFVEDAKDKELGQALESGLRAWSQDED